MKRVVLALLAVLLLDLLGDLWENPQQIKMLKQHKRQLCWNTLNSRQIDKKSRISMQILERAGRNMLRSIWKEQLQKEIWRQVLLKETVLGSSI